MPFDMGFDARWTAAYVTDPAYGVAFELSGWTYPHTYTNGNGQSLNAGYTSAPGSVDNLSASNDPRIAGVHIRTNGNESVFQADLSSGSAPGAGTYTIDLAFGAASSYVNLANFKLFDNTTLLIDGTNGGSGFSTANGHYIDATLADVAATTSWTGATTSVVFATTTALLKFGGLALANNTVLAHFRLTLAGGTSTDITPDTGSASLVGYQPTLTGQMTITTVFSNLGDQGFIAFQAQAINKVEASLDGVTYHDITALGRAVTGAILFSNVAFFFYRVTSVGAIVYTTGADKATIN